ncbi:hypothetical protein F5880DRAFT_1548115 [Lentinula raphanica]|nr:hypothetical protein F5880DRAFT_1548115 [Lentinula raphanica]
MTSSARAKFPSLVFLFHLSRFSFLFQVFNQDLSGACSNRYLLFDLSVKMSFRLHKKMTISCRLTGFFGCEDLSLVFVC